MDTAQIGGETEREKLVDDFATNAGITVNSESWIKAVYVVGYNQALVDMLEMQPEDKSLRDMCLDLLQSAKNLSFKKVVAKMMQEQQCKI
jgi:hypothetical protein